MQPASKLQHNAGGCKERAGKQHSTTRKAVTHRHGHMNYWGRHVTPARPSKAVYAAWTLQSIGSLLWTPHCMVHKKATSELQYKSKVWFLFFMEPASYTRSGMITQFFSGSHLGAHSHSRHQNPCQNRAAESTFVQSLSGPCLLIVLQA
jgi:hypothetical protein